MTSTEIMVKQDYGFRHELVTVVLSFSSKYFEKHH